MISLPDCPANRRRVASVEATIFFDQVRDAFDQAVTALGSVRSELLTIAGHSLRLYFAGEDLAERILPALAHLTASRSNQPDLQVLVWDSDSTGIPLPATPWTDERHLPRGDVIGFENGRIRTAMVRDPDILSLLDTHTKTAIFWTRTATKLPHWESGSPLKAILSWWAEERGLRYVHAAAVGRPDGGVLIVGKGGSGKSTTAISCLQSSLHYCGDDYVLAQADPEPYVFSLYNSGKLAAEHAPALPHITGAITNRQRLDSEKALIFVKSCFPASLIAGFPIRAILVPKITDVVPTRLQPTSAARRALFPGPEHDLSASRAGRETFEFLSRLVKQVPCWRLELGRDLTQIPAVIDGLLASR